MTATAPAMFSGGQLMMLGLVCVTVLLM